MTAPTLTFRIRYVRDWRKWVLQLQENGVEIIQERHANEDVARQSALDRGFVELRGEE